ncbi:MAG: flagellar hook-associated protein FlgK [Clostridiales bacterium]|nr:flagellar hook-associated protein FlgK [Clostridiales bacterium]
MPSQFFGLNIAYTGLMASNAALNTTGNNISNVETIGYSRQRVKQTAADALRTFTTYGCAGAGVETLAIERIRNEFYDVKYWNNNSRLGDYGIKQYYMKQIENYFMDDPDNGIDGFSTIFDKMYEAMAQVKKNAGDIPTKAQFVGYAKSLCEYFNSMANDLQEMQKDVNAEIKNKVEEINSIAAEIATLNKQINVIELTGSNANELRDRRSVLIDQLSAIVDVEVKETPVIDDNDPTRVTGANKFSIKIAGGQTLVDTNEYNTLQCVAKSSGEKVNLTDADGMYDIVWSNGLEVNLYGNNLGGELKALIQMRDGNNGKQFKGTAGTDAGDVDVAGKTITVDVTEDYLLEVNQCNLSETGGVLLVGNREYHYTSWTMTKKMDAAGNVSCSYTFELDETPLATDAGREVSIGKSVQYQGIPYYMSQMNEWVRSFSEAFNRILTQDGAIDDYGDPATQLFLAQKKTDSTQYTFGDQEWVDDGAGGKILTVTNTNDTLYQMTALNLTISDIIAKDAGKFASKTGNADEADRYDVIDQLIKMKSDKSQMAYRNSAAGEFLQTILADIGLGANSANTFYKNFTNISQSIENQRTSISGVDNDEEALNLTKYQHAYNLASKMIQTLTEVYDRLILQTGV